MTAVEWLEMEIVKLEKDYAIPGNVYKLCEQAKEMETKQIIDFAYYFRHEEFTKKELEQYYNEKFKK